MDVDDFEKLKNSIAIDVVLLAVKSGLSVSTVLDNVEEETKKIIKDVLM